METAEGVFRAREVRRLEQEDRWDKEAINNVIGHPWRIVDGKWPVDRPTIQIDPLPPPPPVPFEGARVQSESITRAQVSKPSEPLPDARVATRSDLESELKPTPTSAVSGFRSVSITTPEGSERSDRRREVLNAALARRS